jgi:hypothetical protein
MDLTYIMEQYDNEFKRKDGFVDYEPLSAEKECRDNEHNLPGHIVLKPGKHTYKCPSCGKITVINVPLITY